MVSGTPRWSNVVVSSGRSRISCRTPVWMPSKLPRMSTGLRTRAVRQPATSSSCWSTASNRSRRSTWTWSASGRIRCNLAAAERTSSQSGSGSAEADMVHPEVVPLGIGVVDVSRADALDPIQEARIVDRSTAQVGPILPPPARDDVVDRCSGVVPVVQVAVFHGNPSVQFGNRVDCTPRGLLNPCATPWRTRRCGTRRRRHPRKARPTRAARTNRRAS